ncbi:MAG: hypothetical protein P8173_17550 [Gammaproteobacteria bacterium]
MLSKIIKAWGDSYQVAEHRRIMGRTAERLVWSGRGPSEVRFSGRRLTTVSSWN